MKRILLLSILSAMALSSCSNAPKAGNDAAAQAVLDVIAARTSVRSYTSDPVPQEMVDKLLRAAMAAPSSKNRQPWEFVVVDDRAILDSLASRLRFGKMLFQAPMAIVVCAHTTLVTKDGLTVPNKAWRQDGSAATENILLAAKALGLGAVWTEASDDERSAIVAEALGLEGDVRSLSVIPIGWPAENPEPKDKWKPERIHHNRW